ncbi:MAG: multidrug transporter [Gammaproteobacteria bacterium]|nr:multidrug transporter [Gammaproteobacteria bacterium]
MKGSALVTVAAAITVLSACTMEPHYERPAAPVPPTWAGSAAGAEDKASVADVGWRQFFPDPVLQRLMAIALANNRDLRVAVLNVQAAQAQYRIQRADLFPKISATGLEQVEKYPSGVLGTSSSTGTPVPGGTTIRFFEAGVGFTSYELDLFGKIRSLNHAALEQYFENAETRRSSQLTLVAEVASAYLAILADETILKVTRETLDSQTASYDLTKKSLDAGTSTALALRQAATTVDTARANLAEYTRQAAQDRNALMLLLGAPIPEDIVFSTDINAETMSADLPVGVPSEVLTRRPDVLAAEHQLISANADIGAARAAFFPSITLTGNYGTASTQLSGLFKRGSSAWTFSPQISVPIFAGGANVANLDLSKIEKNVYIAQYEKALQSAFREVDDALAARKTLDDQLAAQRALLDDSSESYRLADMRFRNGVDSFLPVLDAQRALYSAQQAVVGLELQRLQNMATLYKALGGGMKEDSDVH